ncbi:MAG: ROK family protein [Planctomycetes bacterium]|nr:ROK family protein [Planctomycetota bacterium]
MTTPDSASRVSLGGLDIGGTKIGVSVGDLDGRVLAADRLPSARDRAPEELLAAALARLRELCAAAGLPPPAALGAACPGPLSYAEGRLLEVPNMPRWQGFRIGAWLDAHGPGIATFMNDANASVLAEALWGAARGVGSAVFLTMSTGMGAGLWLDGRVYEGPLALAGEIGHLQLRDEGPVGFGRRGSVEGYGSGPGMVQVARAERLICEQVGRPTRLGAGGEEITPERICALAREGDPAAVATVDRCGAEIGRLCAMLVDLLNPDRLILGTIGTAYPDLWLPRLRRAVDAEAIPAAAAHVQIVTSGLRERGDQTALAVARRAWAAGRASDPGIRR